MSYHGIALNVAPNLADFDLIDACGMPGVVSTSIARELRASEGAETAVGDVVERAAWIFAAALARRLGTDLTREPAR